MNTFVVYCRSGQWYFVQSATSTAAVNGVVERFAEHALCAEPADEVPPGNPVHTF